jgi:hypothetical protein
VDASTQELRVPSWLPALREKHRKTIRKGPTAFLLIKTDSHLILVAHTEKKSGHQKRFQWRIVTIMPLQNLIKQTFTKALLQSCFATELNHIETKSTAQPTMKFNVSSWRLVGRFVL